MVMFRASSGGADLYVFAHGLDFMGALGDFVALAGPVPLKPWRAHGVWTSREMPVTDAVAREVVGLYSSNNLPLQIYVLDYGWHMGPYDPRASRGRAYDVAVAMCHAADGAEDVNTTCNAPNHAGGQCLQGFGGYVWDRTFFADPASFQVRANSAPPPPLPPPQQQQQQQRHRCVCAHRTFVVRTRRRGPMTLRGSSSSSTFTTSAASTSAR